MRFVRRAGCQIPQQGLLQYALGLAPCPSCAQCRRIHSRAALTSYIPSIRAARLGRPGGSSIGCRVAGKAKIVSAAAACGRTLDIHPHPRTATGVSAVGDLPFLDAVDEYGDDIAHDLGRENVSRFDSVLRPRSAQDSGEVAERAIPANDVNVGIRRIPVSDVDFIAGDAMRGN